MFVKCSYASANLRAMRITRREPRTKRQMSIQRGEVREGGGDAIISAVPAGRGCVVPAAARGRAGSRVERATSFVTLTDSIGMLGCEIGPGWTACSSAASLMVAIGPGVAVVADSVGAVVESELEPVPEAEVSAETGINSLFFTAQVGQTQSCDLPLVLRISRHPAKVLKGSKHTILLSVYVLPLASR